MPDDKKENWVAVWLPLAVLVVFVVLAWAIWFTFGVQYVHGRLAELAASRGSAASTPMAELGQVGDLFGGINALFAALAGAAVFWAGYLQHRTLVATQSAREEEKQRYVVQLDEERARHRREQFEATFFQLLALLRDLLQGLRLRHHKPGVTSDLPLDSVVDDILNIAGGLHGYQGAGSSDVSVAWKVVRDRAQDFVFANNYGQLSPLFRTVYELFNHLGDVARAEPEIARKYADIAKAQLTDPMLVIFALYSLLDSTKPYVDSIERYHLLETLKDHKYVRPVFSLRYHYSAFDPSIPYQGT